MEGATMVSLSDFIARIGYELTDDQKQVINNIEMYNKHKEEIKKAKDLIEDWYIRGSISPLTNPFSFSSEEEKYWTYEGYMLAKGGQQ